MRLLVFCFAVIACVYAAKIYEDYKVTPFEGGKYLLSSFNASWVEANQFCKSIGFELLNVETEDEHYDILDSFGPAIPNRAWIGGSDLGRSGDYYWSQTLETFDTLNFTMWHDGEPSFTNPNTGVSEDCVHYRNINDTILWNDAPCDFKYQFICEITSVSCLSK